MCTILTTKNMKKKIKVKKRYIVILVLLVIVTLIRHISLLTAWYSYTFYPFFSWLLSCTSRSLHFSLGDVFITLSFAVLIGAWIVRCCIKKRNRWPWKKLLGYEIEYLLWIYIWFSVAWGINYEQPSFYQRAHVKKADYSEAAFRAFVTDYIHELNVAYCPVTAKHPETVKREVLNAYRKMGRSFGINPPGDDTPPVKRMLFPRLISGVGVTGYMGPFFAEYNLNPDLLPAEYPFTYAHEFSHWLGITNESEANLYAYMACTRSQVRSIRYSGYFSILGYVLRNAKMIYKPAEYKQLRQSILPQVRYQYDLYCIYWDKKYSTVLGSIQNFIYDFYLRSNNIPMGVHNYSQVIDLIISCRENNIN